MNGQVRHLRLVYGKAWRQRNDLNTSDHRKRRETQFIQHGRVSQIPDREDDSDWDLPSIPNPDFAGGASRKEQNPSGFVTAMSVAIVPIVALSIGLGHGYPAKPTRPSI